MAKEKNVNLTADGRTERDILCMLKWGKNKGTIIKIMNPRKQSGMGQESKVEDRERGERGKREGKRRKEWEMEEHIGREEEGESFPLR